tara:strand:- start:605 stop:1453 length:849 start_codon:yes stop_codon:yes gene_type:complete
MNRFNLDAAIMFSDILVVPEALGMKFKLVPKVGPVFEQKISNNIDIKNLNFSNNYFKNIYNGIASIRTNLNQNKSLIGFAGTPWTVACYMLEGKPGKDYMKLRSLMIENPDSYKSLMEKITNATINYIDGQIESGVNAIQIFDSNGTYISKDCYEKYSLPYICKIINHINSRNIPSIYFAKGLCNDVDLILKTNSKVLGIDWTVNIGEVKRKTGNKAVLQGNLDPAVLLSSNKTIRKEVSKIIKAIDSNQGYIFNLGHGITPNVNPSSVKFLIETVNHLTEI